MLEVLLALWLGSAAYRNVQAINLTRKLEGSEALVTTVVNGAKKVANAASTVVSNPLLCDAAKDIHDTVQRIRAGKQPTPMSLEAADAVITAHFGDRATPVLGLSDEERLIVAVGILQQKT